MSQPPQLLIIAPLWSLSARTRLTKFAQFAHRQGMTVGHWGWSRKEGDTAEPMLGFPLAEKRMLLSRSLSGWRIRLMYPLWSLLVFFNLLFRPHAKTVYCLGLETAIGAWMASFIRPVKYVFDDADRLLMILGMKGPLRRLITWFEIKVSKSARAHIIPGVERYDYESPTFFEVKNTPTATDMDLSREVVLPTKPAPLTVYVNGWLGETRGLPVLLEAARRVADDDRIAFLSAGRLDVPASRAFVNLPNVHYRGEVAAAESLALYAISDVVVTMYDPKIEINRYAESNKWGDAIVTGTPVIVNEEVKTAGFLRNAGAAFSMPYADAPGLAKIFRDLAEQPTTLENAATSIEALRSSIRPFDTAIEGLIRSEFK